VGTFYVFLRTEVSSPIVKKTKKSAITQLYPSLPAEQAIVSILEQVLSTDNTNNGENMDFIRIVIAILLPPLGVFMQVGFAGAFWLNILLTLCGYIPGIVHAVWIIARR